MTVAIQGDRNKKGTALVTLHDIGQNHVKCFQSYFCFHQTKPLLKNFTTYHINFPGQEENAEDLPEVIILSHTVLFIQKEKQSNWMTVVKSKNAPFSYATTRGL